MAEQTQTEKLIERIIFLENNLELVKRDIKARDCESALYRISQSLKGETNDK